MKKIISLIFVLLIMASLCACSDKGDETEATTAVAQYEQALYGDWKRENSDITITLEAGNSGKQTQGTLAKNLYWEVDEQTILLKTNMVGEQKGVPYTLSGDTLTISNEDGTTTVYTRVK